jgi:hypothetical protein
MKQHHFCVQTGAKQIRYLKRADVLAMLIAGTNMCATNSEKV